MPQLPPVTARGYRGYERRDLAAEDPELTHVGPDTACGEYLRKVWQPVAMSSELGDLPLAVRILGEDLVLFRDRDDRVGLLHRHCSHRGASLEYGIVMQQGISCCYHGWHYDIDGSILSTPGEPADSRIKDSIVHGAYPAFEYNGIVFAYLGPPDERPEFPVFDTMNLPDTVAKPFSIVTPCNWLQVYENTQDPVHVVYLHARMSGVQFGAASGATQVIDYRETPLGMINIQTRHWGDHVWTRTTDSILPNGNQTGAIWEEAGEAKYFARVSMTRWMVPVDDTSTVTIGWRYFSDKLDPDGLGDIDAVGKESIDFIGQTANERSYEDAQRQPGDYEAQVSQRPIARHAMENRGVSDRGVVMLRKLIRKGIRHVADGGTLDVPSGDTVATYCQDTVHPYPGDVNDEHALLTRFGDRVADVVLSSDDQPMDARARALKTLCDAEFN